MKRLLTTLLIGSALNFSFAQEQGIINNSESPHVKLKAINFGDCEWTEGFWADKFKLAEDVMVPHMGDILKGDIGGAYNNFKIVAGLKEGEHFGTNWHDGDFYKWMEAAMYVYGTNGNESIVEELDEIIAVIAKAQADDGYLHTKVMINDIERFSNRQLHEMYNAGHLFTAASIHKRLTGKSNFLDIAIKHADFLYTTFTPCPPELYRIGFNQTNITGLVELYRTTKDKRYLELAQGFIDRRGEKKNWGTDAVSHKHQGDMSQDRTPFRKEREAEGHAVLGMYLYSGAADVYAETGEKSLLRSLDSIWSNVVDQKMYVTGAIGQTHHGASSHVDMVHEAFIDEYLMPNATAYNETCANICNAMFSWRMLGIKGEAKYADIMELVLYNSALSGISADGTHYFYTNPLRRTSSQELDKTDYATRTPYIPCFCCPPNLVRTIAKVSGWAYSLSENGIAVNLYGGNKLDTNLADGSTLKLEQVSNYPWDGAVSLKIQECKASAFEIMLRIPEWAAETEISVNGKTVDATIEAGEFATLKRKWNKGDVISMDIPVEPQLVVGHPRIEETRNQVAIKRGPVVYCVETPDLPKNTSVLDVYLPSDLKFNAEYKPEFLGGITTLNASVKIDTSEKKDDMYRVFSKPEWKEIDLNFVPYFSWSNRGEAEMTVWMPIMWN